MTLMDLPESDVVAVAEHPTLDAVLDRLGGIPADRILTTPPIGTAVESQLVERNDHGTHRYELIDGTLVKKTMGNRESILAGAILRTLGNFVFARRLGWVLGADSLFRLFPDQVRSPDVAFVSVSRWPKGLPDKPVAALTPDLGVEVLSLGNTAKEMARKRQEYFQTGMTIYWQVDPVARTVRVYSAAETFEELDTRGTLTGGAVLPGLTVPVADIFAELDLTAG